MLKKIYHIKDEDGAEYKVEEVAEAKADDCQTTDEVPALTEDELVALRKLLPHADKLVALIKENVEDTTDLPDEKVDTEDEDDLDEEDLDAEKEKVVDTDKLTQDSKRSAGSIEKSMRANDSIEVQDSITNAWAQRYSNLLKGDKD